MSLLDVSIVNVALPSIQRGLDASPGTTQWVVSGYALAFGLALVPAGRLGDTFGRRPMFMIALAAFVTTSALSGAAPTIELLIVARLLQGVAGGALTPQNSGLIQDLFRGPERGRAFGVLGATIGLSTAVGPVVGGLILAAFGDRTAGAGCSMSTCRSALWRSGWPPGWFPGPRVGARDRSTWIWWGRCYWGAVSSA
jgi:MFS family permease